MGAYRLWSHVCRHTSKRCMKTCAVLQLRCSASHYTCQSLCLVSTLAFGQRLPVAPPTRSARVAQEATLEFFFCSGIRTQWHRTAIHTQATCLCISSHIVELCLLPPPPRRDCTEEGLPQGRSDTVHSFMRHHQASARMSEALGSACLARHTDQITLHRSTFPSWHPHASHPQRANTNIQL